MDDFFSFVSKAVIVIPIVVVILSLVFRFNQSLPKKNSLINNFSTPSILPTPKSEFKFDLKGPIVCDSLFIKDKKILFRNKVTNYLLNGDCLYSWDEGVLNGDKQCGLSNYVSMAENYLGSLNINDLVNNNLVKNFIADKDIDLTGIVKNCKREDVKDDSIFGIPEKILFKIK